LDSMRKKVNRDAGLEYSRIIAMRTAVRPFVSLCTTVLRETSTRVTATHYLAATRLCMATKMLRKTFQSSTGVTATRYLAAIRLCMRTNMLRKMFLVGSSVITIVAEVRLFASVRHEVTR